MTPKHREIKVKSMWKKGIFKYRCKVCKEIFESKEIWCMVFCKGCG